MRRMITPYDKSYGFLQQAMLRISQCTLVLDLGTFHAFRKELKAFEPLFEKTRYICMGYKTGSGQKDTKTNVDGDICRLPFRDEATEAIICKDVLEHVLFPEQAIAEMHRVLKKSGLLYCSIPFCFPYHGTGNNGYGDLWRFTRDGIHHLFRSFDHVEVVAAGGFFMILRAFIPHPFSRFLYSFPMAYLVNVLDSLVRTRNTTTLYLVLARK